MVQSWMRKYAGDREILRPLTTGFGKNFILVESMIDRVCNFNVQDYSLHFLLHVFIFMRYFNSFLFQRGGLEIHIARRMGDF